MLYISPSTPWCPFLSDFSFCLSSRMTVEKVKYNTLRSLAHRHIHFRIAALRQQQQKTKDSFILWRRVLCRSDGLMRGMRCGRWNCQWCWSSVYLMGYGFSFSILYIYFFYILLNENSWCFQKKRTSKKGPCMAFRKFCDNKCSFFVYQCVCVCVSSVLACHFQNTHTHSHCFGPSPWLSLPLHGPFHPLIWLTASMAGVY